MYFELKKDHTHTHTHKETQVAELSEMFVAGGATVSTPFRSSSLVSSPHCNSFSTKITNPLALSGKKSQSYSLSLTFPSNTRTQTLFTVKASSSVGSAEYIEEPATSVKFHRSLSLPGCSSPLSLLGTGYREKVFAIIGVKVYAAGLYVNQTILSKLKAWKGRSAAEIQADSSLFNSIFQAPLEKSLQIVLVRDVDGKTFWDALDDAISPRMKTPTPIDESALSTFHSIFQDRPLKKGTFIFLTWLDTSKIQVGILSDGLPTGADATIESENVTFALYDVFFGNAPVSPSLKASVATGLATNLK